MLSIAFKPGLNFNPGFKLYFTGPWSPMGPVVCASPGTLGFIKIEQTEANTRKKIVCNQTGIH